MLPDFPEIKRALAGVVDGFIRQRISKHLGELDEVKRVTLREGGQNTKLVRADGDVESSELQLRSASFEMSKDELATITLEKLFARLDKTAEDMAAQMAQDLYAAVNRAVDRVGNSVDAQGKAIDAALLLEAFNKVHMDFDRWGRPILPTLTVHPTRAEAAQLALDALQRDPELRQRFAYLIAEKREQWREREAGRKLVG